MERECNAKTRGPPSEASALLELGNGFPTAGTRNLAPNAVVINSAISACQKARFRAAARLPVFRAVSFTVRIRLFRLGLFSV